MKPDTHARITSQYFSAPPLGEKVKIWYKIHHRAHVFNLQCSIDAPRGKGT